MVQLEDMVNKNPIYLSDRGVSHLNPASVNTQLIQQAINEAQLESRPVIFPWVPDGAFIDINAPISILTGGIQIKGFGLQTRIRQTAFPKAILDVLANNVTIEDLSFHGINFNATGLTGAFRGNATLHNYYCGVWVTGSNATVRNVTGESLSCVVVFNNWNQSSSSLGERLKGCQAHSIRSKNVWCNLLVIGVDGFSFSDITGHYKLMTGTGQAPHLIYFSSTGTTNINVFGRNCLSEDGEFSYAYQFKGISGGEFSNLHASNTKGILHLMDCEDLIFNNVLSQNDTWDDQAYASFFLEATNRRIISTNISIRMSGDGKPFRLSEQTSDSLFDTLDIISNHTLSSSISSLYDIDIHGTNNEVRNAKVKNIGPETRSASIGFWGGVNNVITNPKTEGNAIGVEFRGSGIHTLKDYTLEELKFRSVAGASKPINISVATPDFKLIPKSRDLTQPLHTNLMAYDRGNVFSGSTLNAGKMTSGQPWAIKFGTWKLDGLGGLYNDVGVNALIGIDTAKNNIDLRATLKYANREHLVIRAIDNKNNLSLYINHVTGNAEIRRKKEGETEQILKSSPFIPQVGRRYDLRVVAFDNVIDFYIDNYRHLSYTISPEDVISYGANTFHGLGGNGDLNARWSNVEYRQID